VALLLRGDYYRKFDDVLENREEVTSSISFLPSSAGEENPSDMKTTRADPAGAGMHVLVPQLLELTISF
jgi:hypothetical protein